MARERTIEVCKRHLFSDIDAMEKDNIPKQIVNRMRRLRFAYTNWNDFPMKPDKEIRDILVREFGISQPEAYEDIKLIKQLIGDINAASKAWHRFRFIEMITETYTMAKQNENLVAMAMAADKYAKYNKLDQEDIQEYPWDEIIPQPYEISSDPTLIGIQPIVNIKQKIAAMKQKYMSDIEDIDFEEIGINPELLEEIKSYGD